MIASSREPTFKILLKDTIENIKKKKSPLGKGSTSINTVHILPLPASRSPSQAYH
jgi:hypothetical protein